MPNQNKHYQDLPQFPEPYWRDHLSFPNFPKLTQDIETDVAIVGGGISGITAAYLLAEKGIRTVLIEAGSILTGTTGHTTAKITAQHGLIYDQLITDHGEEKAKLYYQANKEAMDFIKKTAEIHDIDCDLTMEDAYVYAETDEYASKIESEMKAYERLGIPGEYTNTIPFSVPCQAAIIMKKQYQFHPLKYLTGLIPLITNANGAIFEHTTAMKVEDGEKPVIITDNGAKIACNHVITASHFPFNDEMGLYFARMHAERSYVLAVKTKNDFPGGMYISADTPSRTFRYTTLNGEKLVLIGGETHKTGQGISMMEHYEAIHDFAEKHFGINDIPYRWSAQDYVTPDHLPFIGRITSNHPNVLVATGFAKWGITKGTIAAKIMTDAITNEDNRYAELFSPSRSHLKGAANIVKDNLDVAKHLIQGKFAMVSKLPEELTNDEGAIVRVNGDKAGCYRDTEGTLHIVDSTCTHMGCEVEWNSGERTWDCPCHASRFSITGEVLEGPAVEPLKQITLE